MEQFDVVILTESKYVDFTPTADDWYSKNVLLEDNLLKDAFTKHGKSACIKSWDDPYFDWSRTKAVVFRTTWDYFHRFVEFEKWMKETSKKCQMFNSYEQIMWNIDKVYLKELENNEIAIPPTYFIRKGDKRSLAEICSIHNWKEYILKPNISGAARHTYKLNENSIEQHEELFKELIQKEDFLLQEYLESITEKGEISLIVIGGEFTHAIHKKAKQGDFRVQDDFGGTIHDYTPKKDEIEFAEKAIATLKELPAYARVDLVWDNKSQLCISELEMIEPELWFRKDPNAADLLAKFICQKI